MAASHQVVNDFDVRAILKRTSGGDNDTELNELTVAPTRVPSLVIVVTTATPVGKRPRASRKLRSVIVIAPFLLVQALPGQSRKAWAGRQGLPIFVGCFNVGQGLSPGCSLALRSTAFAD